MTARQARHLDVVDVLDRVRAARVLRQRRVVVVHHARLGREDDVLEHGAEADGVEDVGLFFRGQADALRVAAALDVEDAVVRPAVLVVADERALRVRRQRRLARARQAEEHGHVAVLTFVRGRV